MLDADECREHARQYATMAAEIDDPLLKQRFEETAAGWLRIAADLANLDAQMATLRSEERKMSLSSIDIALVISLVVGGTLLLSALR